MRQDIEEDGLALTLQPDVEAELIRLADCRGRDERRPAAGVGDGGQHRIGVIRGCLVGEVDPGHYSVKQTTGEHRVPGDNRAPMTSRTNAVLGSIHSRGNSLKDNFSFGNFGILRDG